MIGKHGRGQRACLKTHRRQNRNNDRKRYPPYSGKVVDGCYFLYFIGIHHNYNLQVANPVFIPQDTHCSRHRKQERTAIVHQRKSLCREGCITCTKEPGLQITRIKRIRTDKNKLKIRLNPSNPRYPQTCSFGVTLPPSSCRRQPLCRHR